MAFQSIMQSQYYIIMFKMQECYQTEGGDSLISTDIMQIILAYYNLQDFFLKYFNVILKTINNQNTLNQNSLLLFLLYFSLIQYYMQDFQRRQKLFYNRAHHRLREIEFSCKEVITMSKIFNTLAKEISQSEVNCRKLEIIKSEIKEKLRQFASNIDQIYKILDRKIVIILNQLAKSKLENNKNSYDALSPDIKLNAMKHSKENDRMNQSEIEKISIKSNGQRIFSDTLNPRITNLEAKIIEYQQNEINYKKKIFQLKDQNNKLIEEFDRLSNASNKTINELRAELNSKYHKNVQQNFQIAMNQQHQNRPSLNLNMNQNNVKNISNSPCKVKRNQIFYQIEDNSTEDFQHFYQSPEIEFNHKTHKTSILNFGCMPTNNSIIDKPSLLNLQSNGSYDHLDKNDRNRRWDLMLNKLRISQQQSTQGSCEQFAVHDEERGVPFTPNLIKKHQI